MGTRGGGGGSLPAGQIKGRRSGSEHAYQPTPTAPAALMVEHVFDPCWSSEEENQLTAFNGYSNTFSR